MDPLSHVDYKTAAAVTLGVAATAVVGKVIYSSIADHSSTISSAAEECNCGEEHGFFQELGEGFSALRHKLFGNNESQVECPVEGAVSFEGLDETAEVEVPEVIIPQVSPVIIEEAPKKNVLKSCVNLSKAIILLPFVLVLTVFKNISNLLSSLFFKTNNSI